MYLEVKTKQINVENNRVNNIIFFRANKQQVSTAQKMLKEKDLYKGAETGKLDTDTRAALKSFQSANGLKATGTLNRATLEKMNVELTDAQKLIPVSVSSLASSSDKEGKSDKPKRAPVFRANKEQVTQARKMLKDKGMYSGDATGKLDDARRFEKISSRKRTQSYWHAQPGYARKNGRRADR